MRSRALMYRLHAHLPSFDPQALQEQNEGVSDQTKKVLGEARALGETERLVELLLTQPASDGSRMSLDDGNPCATARTA